jgi:hypothetical protein
MALILDGRQDEEHSMDKAENQEVPELRAA